MKQILTFIFTITTSISDDPSNEFNYAQSKRELAELEGNIMEDIAFNPIIRSDKCLRSKLEDDMEAVKKQSWPMYPRLKDIREAVKKILKLKTLSQI